MKKKLLDLIENENKKNPLTDTEIAEILKIDRSTVTQIRKVLLIPESRERRKSLLIQEIKNILYNMPNISNRNLTSTLNKIGFDISRYAVSRLLEKIKVNEEVNIQSNFNLSMDTNIINNAIVDPFSEIIGWNKGLKAKIEQAKAAILYPPNGLHTLIVGNTGVGKSQLAECMHKFALKTKGLKYEDCPFVVFNCSDYAKNPQLLLSQLFGYKKGAFTGAISDKEGLISKANNGIIFLDEIHRLPPEGQEILFQLIDKGKYRRLGETDANHKAQVMIIAATTEDLEMSLLSTFRRRIPMIIEIPSLSMRSMQERYEIIKLFFHKESTRINKKIEVTHNVLHNLLVYNCTGNLGQLMSDIQVTCASAFLSYINQDNKETNILVDISNLPSNVGKGLLIAHWNRSEIEQIIADKLIFNPDPLKIAELTKDNIFLLPNEIYKNIENSYQKMLKQGLPPALINKIIVDELATKIEKNISQVDSDKSKCIVQNIQNVVGIEIVEMVQEMLKIANDNLLTINDTLLFCLATHLKASTDKIKNGMFISNPHLNCVKENYSKEFEVAKKMSTLTKIYLGIELPEAEIASITMYLKTVENQKIDTKDTIGIIVISHGNVASGMVNVANRLLGVDHAKSIDMLFDENPEIAYKQVLEAVKSAEHSRGVLLLVDMGSLIAFGDLISQETNIKIRTIARVDTLMVIDAVRKTMQPHANLDFIADSLLKYNHFDKGYDNNITYNNTRELAIITMCLTGEGNAFYIQNIIKDDIKKIDKKIKLIALGMFNSNNILEEINKINKEIDVLMIVGTIAPQCDSIPFINVSEILQESGLSKFRELVNIEYIKKRFVSQPINISSTNRQVFHKNLIFLNQSIDNKQDVLKMLCTSLVKEKYVSNNYFESVISRENIGSTALSPCLAIPHGDSKEIITPAVGIMTLNNPIFWDAENMVSLIFILALSENCKNEFHQIYQIIRSENSINKILKATNKNEVFRCIYTM